VVLAHLVKMHDKYKKQGLVIITVSTDLADRSPDEKPEEVLKKVRKYMSTQPADIVHLVLDEPREVIGQRLRFVAAPCLYIFDRQGKWRQLRSDEEAVVPDSIEKQVVPLIDAK